MALKNAVKAAVATGTLLLMLVGCGANKAGNTLAASSSSDVTIHRSLGGEPASLDPGSATDTFSFEVLRDVYEGLTSESPDGSVIPGVARSWTVNKGGTEYVFDLRPNARWSNGARVRPQDFVKAWQRIVDPRFGSPVADTLRPVLGAAAIIEGRLQPTALGVAARGKYQLVVRLVEPAPYFLQLLTHTGLFPIYSEESARTRSPREWVSNGPYVLSRWTPGDRIAISKNRQYWDKQHVSINRVDYLFTPDENAELRDYLAGQIDITDSVPASDLPWIRKRLPGELRVWPFLGTAYYAINMTEPVFKNSPQLRQALAMAIDRKLLVSRVLNLDQPAAYGFVPEGTWNYTPQTWQWKNLSDSQRIAEARRLYRAAGYSLDKPLHLRLLINSNSTIRDTALATAAMWKSVLGVQTAIVEQEYRVFLQSRRDPTQWDVTRLGWTADYDDASDFLDIFRTDSPNNDSRYSDPRFDAIMDRANATGDATRRRELLENAESLALSEYPVVPIYFYVSKRLIKRYIGGASATIMNRLYSRYLYIKPH